MNRWEYGVGGRGGGGRRSDQSGYTNDLHVVAFRKHPSMFLGLEFPPQKKIIPMALWRKKRKKKRKERKRQSEHTGWGKDPSLAHLPPMAYPSAHQTYCMKKTVELWREDSHNHVLFLFSSLLTLCPCLKQLILTSSSMIKDGERERDRVGKGRRSLAWGKKLPYTRRVCGALWISFFVSPIIYHINKQTKKKRFKKQG